MGILSLLQSGLNICRGLGTFHASCIDLGEFLTSFSSLGSILGSIIAACRKLSAILATRRDIGSILANGRILGSIFATCRTLVTGLYPSPAVSKALCSSLCYCCNISGSGIGYGLYDLESVFCLILGACPTNGLTSASLGLLAAFIGGLHGLAMYGATPTPQGDLGTLSNLFTGIVCQTTRRSASRHSPTPRSTSRR